ncbi:hypothetical protein XIS1_1270003 [Xenorhabdus innexi]|uniref:4-hydroxyphenylacetate 3-monooxygenase n=1 Tax=Xenorhabdus innexi TaxID=290109 RepID=A0A1N6MSG8_9GAMM|nr:hypothetical protein [Xenorhabdus innexi]PHM37389.1 4-hydroxyphenylacetate 3-monooxygenase [Xenorhabdus innexi]SIP71786.1 hypothetical protein XIS1_1270003 [Xenorhabdus innexi]
MIRTGKQYIEDLRDGRLFLLMEKKLQIMWITLPSGMRLEL